MATKSFELSQMANTLEVGADETTVQYGHSGTFTGDLTVEGDFTVNGNTITITSTELAVQDNMIFLNTPSAATITSASGDGSTQTYTADNNYAIGYTVVITGMSPAGYNTTGATITGATSTSFTIAGSEQGTYVSGGSASAKSIVNPDLGFIGEYNDGADKHAGLFRDATDGNFKFFDSYTPDPASSINTAHASFNLAPITAGTATFEGLAVDTNTLVVDAANNRIGIGTATPSHSLSIVGSLNGDVGMTIQNTLDNDGTNDANAAAILWMYAASNNGYLRLHGAPTDLAADHQFDIGSTASGGFITSTVGGAERLRIANNGNVGIGTDAPGEKLDVNGDVRVRGTGSTMAGTTVANASLLVGSSSVGIGIDDNEIIAAGGGLYLGSLSGQPPAIFREGTTEYMRINNGGKVGIGTNNPNTRLSVEAFGATGGDNTRVFELRNQSATAYTADALTAYNAHTSYPIVNGATLTYHARGGQAGNIMTHAAGINTEPVISERIARLATQSTGTALYNRTYYAWDGAGTTAADTNVDSNQLLETVGAAGQTGSRYGLYASGNAFYAGTLTLGEADTASAHINAYENMTFNIDTDNDDAGTRYFAWYTNGADASGTELMRIEEGGNVGIGTNAPDSMMHLYSTTGDTILTIEADADDNTEWDNPQIHFLTDGGLRTAAISGGNATNEGSPSNFNALNLQSQTIRFHTGATQDFDLTSEVMRINSSGNVGIGTTNPSAKLTITDEDGGQPMLQVRNFATTATGAFSGSYTAEIRGATSGSQTHGMLVHQGEANDNRRTLDVSDSNGVFATFVNGKVGIGTTIPHFAKLTVNTPQRNDTETNAIGAMVVAGPMSNPPTHDFTNSNAIFRVQGNNATNNLQFGVGDAGYAYNPWIQGSYDNSTSGADNFGPKDLLLNPIGGFVGIGVTDPETTLHIYQAAASPVMLTLHNYQSDISGLGSQGNFIDFKMTDDNATATPQVRIGMTVYDSDGVDAGIDSEGNGNFVVYTNEGTGGAGAGTFTEKFRINEKGNVGIGTTQPTGKLEVYDAAPAANTSVVIHNNSASHAAMFKARGERASANQDVSQFLTDNSGKTIANIRGVTDADTTSGRLEFWTAPSASNAVARMTVDSAGQVGIGTTQPAANLHLHGTGDMIRLTSTNDGSGGAQIDLLHFSPTPANGDIMSLINMGGYYSGTNSAYFSSIRTILTDAAARHGRIEFLTRDDATFTTGMTIDHLGAVGIGTTAPTLGAKFEVVGTTVMDKLVIGTGFTPTTTEDDHVINFIVGSTATATSNGVKFYENTSGFGMSIGYNGTGSGTGNKIVMHENGGSEIFHLYNTTSGDLRLGTGQYNVMHTNYSGTFAGTILWSNTTASTSPTTGAIRISGGLGVAGDIHAGADVTAYSASDQRLKTNLQPIENSLDKVKSLTGYTFNWNELAENKPQDQREAGVLAQDVEAVLPEVTTTRDDGYKAVRYEKMVPMLIEAIKELSNKVEDQQAEINKLKGLE